MDDLRKARADMLAGRPGLDILDELETKVAPGWIIVDESTEIRQEALEVVLQHARASMEYNHPPAWLFDPFGILRSREPNVSQMREGLSVDELRRLDFGAHKRGIDA